MKTKPCPFCGSDNIESGDALSVNGERYYSQAGCMKLAPKCWINRSYVLEELLNEMLFCRIV